MSAGDANSDNANANNIISTIKDTQLYVPVVTLSEKDNQKLSKLLSKGFEKPFYFYEYKTKSENKNAKNEYRSFVEASFVGVNRIFELVYLNRNIDVNQYKTRR